MVYSSKSPMNAQHPNHHPTIPSHHPPTPPSHPGFPLGLPRAFHQWRVAHHPRSLHRARRRRPGLLCHAPQKAADAEAVHKETQRHGAPRALEGAQGLRSLLPSGTETVDQQTDGEARFEMVLISSIAGNLPSKLADGQKAQQNGSGLMSFVA